MGDDSLILREDGYIRMKRTIVSLAYHSNLNKILVKNNAGGLQVLDVNNGVILHSGRLSSDENGVVGVEYAPGADRVFVWDNSSIGARSDYNGVLLLHTALQRPLPPSQADTPIKIELVLSEAVLLYQTLARLDALALDGLSDFLTELKRAIEIQPLWKDVKAQKWCVITITLPQSTISMVTSHVVQELKTQSQRIPALAIASAVGHRANELVPSARDEETRPMMYSEAERKETFKRWPHMDYKWALPARMAQAGFYHQPSPNGDDRAMCFTCMVCLVCWEKSDEPWVEHERHSPNCPFVRGEYTHNVPISVTNATACAVPCPNVAVVSKGNYGDLIATGTVCGKVNIWRFDCGLKLAKFIQLSPYDSIFSGILSMDSNKVWSTSLEKDTSTYVLDLTAMSFVGARGGAAGGAASLACGVRLTASRSAACDVAAMNVANEAASRATLYLLTYDVSARAAAPPPAARAGDNIYDEVYMPYSDEDADLPAACKPGADHLSQVIDLNAAVWDVKVLPKDGGSTSLLPDPPQPAVLDFVGKISQIKSWKSGNIETVVGTKLADQTDANVLQTIPLTHYLNMNGPLEISEALKWYEGGDGTEKIKVTTFGSGKTGTHTGVSNSNNDGFDSDPPAEEAVTQGVAVQCLALPPALRLHERAVVTHLLPTLDNDQLLVAVGTPGTGDSMEVDGDPTCNTYFLLYKINTKTSVYTLEDDPVNYIEASSGESPLDICLLPKDKQDKYSFAAACADGALRVYSLPDFKLLVEKRAPKGQFVSVVHCSSVDRLSAGTKEGVIYFFALSEDEKEEPASNADEDVSEAAEGGVASPAPTAIASGGEPSLGELQTLVGLTGSHGRNATVPYTAVVPGFWCELSPAQRARSDHGNHRTWRLQNTSSTWDEHVLELTSIPCFTSLAHVEFNFTLHTPCLDNLPFIQVTLLKQNLHGIGYKKDANFGDRGCPPRFHFMDDMAENDAGVENPVNSEEYLQAHNAEILAGPLLLSSGLDLSRQSGTLILTSPRLYRSKGHTFLIHIKTLFDPAKDMTNKTATKPENTSKKTTNFIGCDWLHQISIIVRSNPITDMPIEVARHQRIAMLENNGFLNNLFEIALSKTESERRKLALDLIIWVLTIRLQRFRVMKSDKGKEVKDTSNPVESQQLECAKIVERHTDGMLKNCLLCSRRNIAKKCVKIMMITAEGVKQLPRPWKATFEQTLAQCMVNCLPLLPACDSPGAMKWLVAMAQYATTRFNASEVVTKSLALLEKTAKCMKEREDVYHSLLRARFGLYGLPLERTIFDVEGPNLGKYTATSLTYASVLSGDASSPASSPKPNYPLKDLFNLAWETAPESSSGKNSPPSRLAWWELDNSLGVFSAGVCESMPLHVTCHAASGGTKLEATGSRYYPPVVSVLPGDNSMQIWTAVKEGQSKQTSQDPDSLEDIESSTLMECDPQEKIDYNEYLSFPEEAQCDIPWEQLVVRPPQHTLVVERMHSGARRYIVLDFGHVVRLTDIIIPSCSDLVTLCIDIWVTSEEQDNLRIAFATDIATKHLVFTDIQPPPRARYIKITTIGRYGMSAMKCKIPLGWFYGEIDEINNVQASLNSLSALHHDLTCKFRLATGKLIDLLNPYLELYNGNAAHMMAYLSFANDTKVITAYQECIELQEQIHTCNNIRKKLQSKSDCNEQMLELINKGRVNSDMLLERASTDKLKFIMENLVDMLLYFFFQVGDVGVEECTRDWWCNVWAGAGSVGPRSGAALGTLAAKLAGPTSWWGPVLADTVEDAFRTPDANPAPIDRVLMLVMYMSRKSLHAHGDGPGGVTAAFASRALALLRAPQLQPALLAAMLTALAAALDAPAPTGNNRWDWVGGGRVEGAASGSSGCGSRGRLECRLHRRKVHKRGPIPTDVGVARCAYILEERYRARMSAQARAAGMGSRSSTRGEPDASSSRVRLLPRDLARELAMALVAHMLAMDASVEADNMLLCAKVVGRLSWMWGGGSLLDSSGILGLARLAITLQPWPKHALTNLLQDLVEYETLETPVAAEGGVSGSAEAAGGSASPRQSQDDNALHKMPAKRPFRFKSASVADVLADSFALAKSKSKQLMNTASEKLKEQRQQLMSLVAVESDDSEGDDKMERYFLDAIKKELKADPADEKNCAISWCVESRVESATEGLAELGARRLLLRGAGALAAAVRAPPPAPKRPPLAPQAPHAHAVLAHTLYDVFGHLATDCTRQTDCAYLESVVSLWLALNGSGNGNTPAPWTEGVTWAGDVPKIRLSTDTVRTILQHLCSLETVTLRCWTLTTGALAWVCSQPLQIEGNNHTMSRVILECEHFVPAIVKFVTMNVSSDGSVTTPEPYLSGACVGAGWGGAATLQALLTRSCGTGRAGSGGAAAEGALLRAVSSAWATPPQAAAAYDLHAALLRVAANHAHPIRDAHLYYAVELIGTIARESSSWIVEYWSERRGRGESGEEGRLTGLLADVLAGAGASAHRRTPLRRQVLAQLLHYARKLLALPLADHAQALTSPARSEGEASQTDESKAARQHESTNLEDERKQRAIKPPTVADTVILNPDIMNKFFKTLQLCDNLNAPASTSETNGDLISLEEGMFWLLAQLIDSASDPASICPTLMEFLKKEELVNISHGLQSFVLRLLDKPEAMSAFVEADGVELVCEKITKCHQSGPNNRPGLVSSLMSHLKLPPQLINMSPCPGTKKSQMPATEPSGLINFAPMCAVSCGNPTAGGAEALVGGEAGGCAARRVRAAAWSYHFFSADDASLALTLQLPHAVRLHEVTLQPHLTGLATCPGAVCVEAGCGGTLAPLGPPQNTAGMTFIRLVVANPVVCTTVQIRLYKPRDSTNLGLLQLKILGVPAFNYSQPTVVDTNRWASILCACSPTAGVDSGRGRDALSQGGAGAALAAAAAAGCASARKALLRAAQSHPPLLPTLLHSLFDTHMQGQQWSVSSSTNTGAAEGARWACGVARALCLRSAHAGAHAACSWLASAARTYALTKAQPPVPALHIVANILWTLNDENMLSNLEEHVTDELFGLIYDWVTSVPETNILKKALDSVLCSMCYIRPELYRTLLDLMDVPSEQTTESMAAMTDDGKVTSPTTSTARSSGAGGVRMARAGRLRSIAAGALSPPCRRALTACTLPADVAAAIADFSTKELQKIREAEASQEDISMDSERQSTSKSTESISLKTACHLVDWLRLIAIDFSIKTWLGAEGSVFWKPLLTLLCHPRQHESTWQEMSQYAQLEENTIRLFIEMTSCHEHNQKLFANTLHDIIDSLDSSGPEGISGFTRALILRLLLSVERVRVCVRWANDGANAAALGDACPISHPSVYAHHLLYLPTSTTVAQMCKNHRPPLPIQDDSTKLTVPNSAGSPMFVVRRLSDTTMAAKEIWELSLAAASASKDKRVKDVKNTLKQQTKKRLNKITGQPMFPGEPTEETASPTESSLRVRVRVRGCEGYVAGHVTLAQLAAARSGPGPYVTLTLHLETGGDTSPDWVPAGVPPEDSAQTAEAGCAGAALRWFGECGGLALVAARLPRPRAAPPRPPARPAHTHDLDWVKLDDHYEELVVEAGAGSEEGASNNAGAAAGVAGHALAALALLLKLRGFAAALLDEGARAVHLLRLLLGLTRDPDSRGGSSTSASRDGAALGTLPFTVCARLLERAPLHSDDGRVLRRALLQTGAVRLVLACLAVFTHHDTNTESQTSNSSSGKVEDKSQLYWAKGTGFGTGSTQQSWNVERALVRQKTEEQHVTALLQVLASYMNPGEEWPPEEAVSAAVDEPSDEGELPHEFVDMVSSSALIPAISSYLRNDSVLDMSRHIPLYVAVLRCARAACSRLRVARTLRPLLSLMARTTASYAAKLRFSSSNSELSEEDEGLASLIADIQATAALLCRGTEAEEQSNAGVPRPVSGATREARYIEVMRRLQFETFEMMEETGSGGFRFTVAHHFESSVRAAGERSHPQRMKRLAQEAATLSTSLPLSHCSSVFVRTDTDRLDVMKVLITGPSDTPYANGCFVLDVYFPAEYPAVPMLINLETTGRHSVRFNPNLYNDGKVCLSVLNTWHGRPEEKWNAHTSSFLQVLVSIQSLILVPEPYFNEPGYERSRGTRVGAAASLEYNSNIYQATVRWAMLDHLRNPSPCFKEVIQTHFWLKRNEIMSTVAGWIVELESRPGDERTQRSIHLNLIALKRHYAKLQEELAKLPVPPGLEDLDEPFTPAPATSPSPAPPSSAPTSSNPAPEASPPLTPAQLDDELEKIVSQVIG